MCISYRKYAPNAVTSQVPCASSPYTGGGGGGCGGGGGIEFPFCSTSCETPKGIQCCKMSIPLGVSQVVSYYKEWRKSGGRGWSNRILLSQLQFLESYKPMSKGKPCLIM